MDEQVVNYTSVCTFIKAKNSKKKPILNETALKSSLNFLDKFQRAVELKVINDFIRKFITEASNFSSTIPVYIFNPSNLISASTCHASLLKDYLKKSSYHVVILDCAEIESKTDFFSEIFKGIIQDSSVLPIPYDFSAFQNAFNMMKPTFDIVLVVKNSSQLNLNHLNDFVRLWERKSKDFATIPQLRFVFDDCVSFLGMEARLRDRFLVKEVEVPLVRDVFDELIIEMIKTESESDLVLLHPILMKRFIDLTEIISLNSILNQFKFLLISHFNYGISTTTSSKSTLSFKDVYLFISELAANLMKIRPSCHHFSPSRDFFPVIFAGILTESQAFIEICNELKSLKPNDFISVFPYTKINTKTKTTESGTSGIGEFVQSKIISEMREKVSESSTSTNVNLLKDLQLNLINSLINYLKSLQTSDIPASSVVVDPKGNVRKAFEADPQAALQTALKYPLIYLNCGHSKTCCTPELFNFSQLVSTNLHSQLKQIDTNRPGMLDTCLLYRLSLEFNSKSINIFNWYKSFVSVVSSENSNNNNNNNKKNKKLKADESKDDYESSPLLISRFFKSLNELQLIGMVSEFGRSRRKRKFVDRFNITDSNNSNE